MPRKPRLKRRFTGWGAEHRAALEHGFDWFADLFPTAGDKTAAWRELRAGIMSDWIAAHPGTRPAGWWLFDAPAGQRRERIDGGIHPHDQADYDLPKTLWRGLPRYRRAEDMEAQFESECEFLARLQLLQPAEIRTLTGRD